MTLSLALVKIRTDIRSEFRTPDSSRDITTQIRSERNRVFSCGDAGLKAGAGR